MLRHRSQGERESARAHGPRETHNQLGEKPPQRLAQEKDRTHIRDATPMDPIHLAVRCVEKELILETWGVFWVASC